MSRECAEEHAALQVAAALLPHQLARQWLCFRDPNRHDCTVGAHTQAVLRAHLCDSHSVRAAAPSFRYLWTLGEEHQNVSHRLSLHLHPFCLFRPV